MLFAIVEWTWVHSFGASLVLSVGVVAALAAAAAVSLMLLHRSGPMIRHWILSAAFWLAAASPFVVGWALSNTDGLRRPAAFLLHRLSATDASTLTAVLIVWATGASFAGLRLAAGLRRLQALRGNAAPLKWRGVDVVIVEDRDLSGPSVAGWRRPCVLAPAGCFESMNDIDRTLLFRHEQEHIARGDFLANVLQRAAVCVLWFHPAIHWMSARLRVEREFCCDDAVGDADERARFARLVVGLAESRRSSLLLGASDEMAVRIRRLLGETAASRVGVGAILLPATLAVAVGWAAVPPEVVPSADAPSKYDKLTAGCPCG